MPTHGRTVADAMVTTPVVHPASITLAGAHEALADPHRHLVLLVRRGLLVGTLDRGDLAGTRPGQGPARPFATLLGRTVLPGAALVDVHAEMLAAGHRRRAVTNLRGELLGLLCLKASGSGFCSDDGVAARRTTSRA